MHTLILLSEGGVDTSLVWLLYIGIGFFFAVIITGWLTSLVKKEPNDALQEEKKPVKKK